MCWGTQVEFISNAEELKGCTVINGSLLIKMNSDIGNLMEELEYYLGDIEEIVGYFKVYRSPSITSLNFMKNLKVIRGERLEKDQYALVVYENTNLQKLIDFSNREKLEILKGGMFFHFNHKLCISVIKKLQQHTVYENASDFISLESNGYKEMCDIVMIKSDYEILSWENVTVSWEHFHSEKLENTTGQVQGYMIYYIETFNENMTWYNGRETCSRYTWKTVVLEDLDDIHFDKNRDMYSYNLTDLKQITKYAFYVRSFQSASDNFINGQTTVKYFTTPIDQLTSPIVTTYYKSPNSITLAWKTPKKEAPLVRFYYVDILTMPDDQSRLDQRDYCLYPRTNVKTGLNAHDAEMQYEEEEVECNCDLEPGEEDLKDTKDHKYEAIKEVVYFGTTVNCLLNTIHHACQSFENSRFKRQLITFEKQEITNNPNHLIEKRNIRTAKNYLTTIYIDQYLRNFTIPDLVPYTYYAFEVSLMFLMVFNVNVKCTETQPFLSLSSTPLVMPCNVK